MTSTRPKRNKTLPPPGETKVYTYIEDGPKYSMGALIPPRQLQYGQSPGTYNMQRQGPAAYLALPLKIAPKFIFGDKPGLGFNSKEHLRPTKTDKPGPGEYISGNKDNMNMKHSTKQDGYEARFGKDKKESRQMILNRNPGPGEYGRDFGNDDFNKVAPQWGFSTAPRIDENKLLKAGDFPGPGAYDTYQKRPYEGLKIGIGMGFGDARGNDKKLKGAMKDPGPGAYDPMLPSASPAYSMGNRPPKEKARKEVAHKTDSKTDKDDDFDREEKPTHKLTSRWSRAEKSPPLNSDKLNTPGPGTYQYEASLAAGPQYTMGVRTKMTHVAVNDTPGPGNYTGDLIEFGWFRQVPTFGTSGRSMLGISKDQGIFPGPNHYHDLEDYRKKYYYEEYIDLNGKRVKQKLLKLPKNEGPFVSFTKSKRDDQVQQTNDPGPGSYNIPSSVGALPKYLQNRKIPSPSKSILERKVTPQITN